LDGHAGCEFSQRLRNVETSLWDSLRKVFKCDLLTQAFELAPVGFSTRLQEAAAKANSHRLRNSPLDDVLQFANIARPSIGLKQIEALFVHRLKALSCLLCVTINEVLDQQGNVFSSFSRCRNLKSERC
jgi:hypothetical protein